MNPSPTPQRHPGAACAVIGLVFLALAAPAAFAADAGAPIPPPVSPAAAPAPFAPLDLPDWVILEDATGAKTLPWILIIDDPQCPYCMQLHLALEKAREASDAEVTRAVVARLPFPLASRANRSWSAAAYLDWLMVEPWKAETEWKTASLEDIVKDGGLFDTKYDAHKVTSSRRREFQTLAAKAESDACAAEPAPPAGATAPVAASCHGDADCEKVRAALRDCRLACPAASSPGGPAGAGAADGSATVGAASANNPGAAPAAREDCLAACSAKFVGARYRQYSKVHSACLLEEGPSSAHGKTAAAFAWALAHKVPGTPTIYAGHPSVGFRLLGDSDSLIAFLADLKSALAETRALLAARAAKAP